MRGREAKDLERRTDRALERDGVGACGGRSERADRGDSRLRRFARNREKRKAGRVNRGQSSIGRLS